MQFGGLIFHLQLVGPRDDPTDTESGLYFVFLHCSFSPLLKTREYMGEQLQCGTVCFWSWPVELQLLGREGGQRGLLGSLGGQPSLAAAGLQVPGILLRVLPWCSLAAQVTGSAEQ